MTALNAAILLVAIAFCGWRYSVNAGMQESAFTKEVPSDLQVYLLGGQRMANHQDLYDGDLLPGLPFTYPPFAGVVFSWFGEPTSALGLWWNALAVGVLVVVCYVASRSINAPLLAVFFILATEPVHATLYFGQINIFLMALVCLDFLPRNRLPGIGTGLAAGLKLTPAYFLVLLAVQGRWGSVAVAAFTFLCTVAVGFQLVPDAARFWTEAMFDSDRVGVADNPGAQALRQVLSRELGIDSTALWLLLAVVVTAVAAFGAYFAYRCHDLPLAVALTGIASCLVSPFSWHHHWVWIVLLGCVVYRWWGAAPMIVLMLPFVAENVSNGLFSVPNLAFTVVPLCFMVVYAACGARQLYLGNV
ncbi:glycosyltransferase 87 family protein [Corynebacterium sp. HMSC29G08]|uniref:glycosyltransferase 87 family protein n=1 Tax=Corynebacterium sp. HMSC29G08 TaxID=1581069 RepID=UPI0008A3C0BF|nr:glycosyltransferase 87 family protein [Corynebacterium sp. HMSC29G08]OFT84021.1 hypothetical protein HMPREF3101_05060 [Corynebacterium sp. HMSC29G08]